MKVTVDINVLRNLKTDHIPRTARSRTINPKPTPQGHDDGLEWLRDIRRKITADFDQDQKKIGD